MLKSNAGSKASKQKKKLADTEEHEEVPLGDAMHDLGAPI